LASQSYLVLLSALLPLQPRIDQSVALLITSSSDAMSLITAAADL